jgi:membrane peptidoglycan carboxypeptidase
MLIYIHKDLFLIEKKILLYTDFWYELSNLEILVLVLEDKRFLRHSGVDFVACFREIVKALLLRNHGGASTIDMQFVRTATGYRQKTLRRKIYEVFLSMLIQYRYSKRTILRSYLKCAFFGSHLIGADRAAKAVFDIYPHQLTEKQAAYLAAMLVYPRPLHPNNEWSAKVTRRAEYGYRRMFRLKKSFQQIPS